MSFITSLKPWTRYAAYIQAITITKAAEGAISDVIYFRTKAEGASHVVAWKSYSVLEIFLVSLDAIYLKDSL